MNTLVRPTASTAPNAAVLIRLMVGCVFLSEGIQKFLFPAEVGAGRFAKIGLPSPESLAPFVGTFEIVCGALVLLIVGAGAWSLDAWLNRRGKS
jgi:uncharacterized membrane protein YphA (DoxX/SURF4 family)